jgi:TonB family protein
MKLQTILIFFLTISLYGNMSPEYPKDLRHKGIDGKVTVIAYVNNNGQVEIKDISATNKQFEKAVVECLPHWRLLNLKEKNVLIPFEFKLVANKKTP